MTFSPRMQALRRRFAQRAMRLFFREGTPSPPTVGHLPLTAISRILICRSVRTLGDSLTLTPLLQEVGETWPGAEIDLVSRCPVAEQLYGSHFGIGRIIALPAHVPGHPIRTLRAQRRMRDTRYDLVIDPDPQSQSGRLLAMLARKKRSLGYRGPRKSGAVTHAVEPVGVPRHHAMQPVFLLRSALGEHALADTYPRLDIRLSPAERLQGMQVLARLLARHPANIRGCIGLFTDATGQKRFDEAWWSRFLGVFRPGATDYAIIEILPATGRSGLDTRYPCFYSGHIRRLAAVLANLSFFVSADGGVMHLASAAGVPTAGIFKVTDASQSGPYGDSNVAIDARALTPEQTAAKALDAFRAAIAVRQRAGSAGEI